MIKAYSNQVIAIDPGREKTGIALLTLQGDVLEHCIVATATLVDYIMAFNLQHDYKFIVMGNGTNSRYLAHVLATKLGHTISCINEYRTTDEARQLYFQMNPPTGWRSLIPKGMLVPPCPIDDYAAIIIGRRFLQNPLEAQTIG